MSSPSSSRTVNLLNPSAKPYAALTPTAHHHHHQPGAVAATTTTTPTPIDEPTLRYGGTGRYYDEYDEDEVDSVTTQTSYLTPRSNSAASLRRQTSADTLRVLAVGRPRSSSTVIDITPDTATLPCSRPWTLFSLDRRPIVTACFKALVLMLSCALMLSFTIWWILPPMDEQDRDKLNVPTSFEDLKQLNTILQIYKTRYFYRVLGSFVLVYLFLQTFSLPGSMYLSILGGAMYGVVMALPLVCFCVATGALFCYAISSKVGGPIISNSTCWKSKLESLKLKMSGRTTNYDLFSYLIILRIAPLPPHWFVNILAPHLGISPIVFWWSTFFGIGGISLIHCQIGTTLDSMTNSNELQLWSLKNLVGLAAIAFAVMIPIILRWTFKQQQEVIETTLTPPIQSRKLTRSVKKEESTPTPTRSSKFMVMDRDEVDVRSIIDHAEYSSDDESEDENVTTTTKDLKHQEDGSKAVKLLDLSPERRLR